MTSDTPNKPFLDSSRITLEIDRRDYAASRIAHAVEDSDTQLLALEVKDGSTHGDLSVVLTVNRHDPMPTVRSLERYGFLVVDATVPAVLDDDTARMRALELLHYLEI